MLTRELEEALEGIEASLFFSVFSPKGVIKIMSRDMASVSVWVFKTLI